MKILQVANFVSPTSGGLRTAIDALRAGYETRGWTVFRITPYPNQTGNNEVFGIPTVKVPFIGNYRVILQRKILKKAVLHIAPDVVELSDRTTLAWLPKWCKKNGIPCCTISHERLDQTLNYAKILKLPLNQLARKWTSDIVTYSSLIVCASKYAADEYLGTRASISDIALGVDVSSITPRFLQRDDKKPFRIVLCGRLSPEKQPELGIEAFRELAKHMDVSMRVIGDGPLRSSLERRARGLDITFVGHISQRAEVYRELRDADVALNLGKHETFGLMTLESLATGTPVVVVNNGASSEIVDMFSGLVTSSDSLSISESMKILLKNSNKDTRHHCRERAEQFPWSRTVENFCTIYESLISRDVVNV